MKKKTLTIIIIGIEGSLSGSTLKRNEIKAVEPMIHSNEYKLPFTIELLPKLTLLNVNQILSQKLRFLFVGKPNANSE